MIYRRNQIWGSMAALSLCTGMAFLAGCDNCDECDKHAEACCPADGETPIETSYTPGVSVSQERGGVDYQDRSRTEYAEGRRPYELPHYEAIGPEGSYDRFGHRMWSDVEVGRMEVRLVEIDRERVLYPDRVARLDAESARIRGDLEKAREFRSSRSAENRERQQARRPNEPLSPQSTEFSRTQPSAEQQQQRRDADADARRSQIATEPIGRTSDIRSQSTTPGAAVPPTNSGTVNTQSGTTGTTTARESLQPTDRIGTTTTTGTSVSGPTTSTTVTPSGTTTTTGPVGEPIAPQAGSTTTTTGTTPTTTPDQTPTGAATSSGQLGTPRTDLGPAPSATTPTTTPSSGAGTTTTGPSSTGTSTGGVSR